MEEEEEVKSEKIKVKSGGSRLIPYILRYTLTPAFKPGQLDINIYAIYGSSK
jgi:hypothetical protein